MRAGLGTVLAVVMRVRILLASIREDPAVDCSASMVVAYIYCEKHQVTIQPVHSALADTRPFKALTEIVAELGGHDPFANLVGLRVRGWSFDVAAVQ
jgi:hypothetical protein